MSKVGAWCLAGLLMASATGWSKGDEGKPQTLAEWHFTGTKSLEKIKELATLTEILKMPETEALRQAGMDGFANHAAARFTKTKATNADPALVELVKQLLPDLIDSESYFEMVAQGPDSADWALAVKVPEKRSVLWSTNLWQLASKANLGQPASAKINGAAGWMVGREKYNMGVSQSKDWLLVEGGFSPLDAHGKIFSDFRKKLNKRAGKELLTADFNLPSLAQLWSAEKFNHAPRVQVMASARKGGLHSETLLDYPSDLGIQPEKWNVPSDLILDPLIGFTAIQGVRKELERSKWVQGLGLEKIPNQIFAWNRSSSPFAVWVAADVGNGGSAVTNIYEKVVPQLNQKLEGAGLGRILMHTNRTFVYWPGLPIIVPFIEPGKGKDSSFIVGGVFPMLEDKPKPAPKELFEQLNQKNLVYYDWEITEARMGQYRPLWQLNYMLRNFVPISTSPSENWIAAVGPKLQNTVTQATLEGPQRLKVVRQSQTGFSALELVLLAHLLDPNDIAAPGMAIPGPAPQGKRPAQAVPSRKPASAPGPGQK